MRITDFLAHSLKRQVPRELVRAMTGLNDVALDPDERRPTRTPW
jgi:hypothetical protein